MSQSNSATLTSHEVGLMLGVAYAMLGIDPPHFARKELTRLCTTVKEVFDVCVAMKNAKTTSHFAAGLKKATDNAASRPGPAPLGAKS